MKAVRLEGLRRLALCEIERPAPGRGELLVRVEASGICGTDRHLFRGEFPCTPPVTLGHEFCGVVEACGEGAGRFAPGQRVTIDPNIACGRCRACHAGRINLCENLSAIGIHRDGGFAEYALAPQDQAHLLPASLNPEYGAFCEPLACCLHAMDLAQVRPGDRVAILGGGVIGLLMVQLARQAGARAVALSTRQFARRRLALELGASATIDPAQSDPIAALAGPNGVMPGGADVVFECAGVVETVEQACAMTRAGGAVILFGVVPKGAKASIEPFDILFRELKILGAFINPFTHARAAAMVAAGALALDPLITRRIALAEVAAMVAQPPAPGEVKVLIRP